MSRVKMRKVLKKDIKTFEDLFIWQKSQSLQRKNEYYWAGRRFQWFPNEIDDLPYLFFYIHNFHNDRRNDFYKDRNYNSKLSLTIQKMAREEYFKRHPKTLWNYRESL